ncbi:MAG: ArnT family glycosyltransferase [Aulosira sp. ZfuVER01]|nr:glycosyltransferase family 39 protein [Aulosira sp. ZfuVER01]MDZ8001516.1 glycosyltransferase family 39 protein [Aulosira sp. DedVER01a]MDZ8051616.1 glycosyltransferase family 39 protein [Aulosira sp. ZfuCHP01]
MSANKLKTFLLFNFIIPASFVIFTIYFMPIQQVFQFDSSDEGIELIKATLHLDGFSMYTQVWNDQPPLFTVILASWLGWFGKSIYSARLLTLSFSTILIWSFCQTIRIYLGNLQAVIGTLMLIISCNFLRLSVSVMIDLPCLVMVMLSIYALTLYKQIFTQKFSKVLIIISGALLGISLQIKLFTGFIVPLIIFDLLQFTVKKNSHRQLKGSLFFDAILWITAFSSVFILIGILCNSLTYEQLLQSHLNNRVKTAFQTGNSLKLTFLFLLQDFDYLLLAILAIIVIFQKKEWEKYFPIIWLITGFIVLLNHRPVWYHHYLLLSIPLAWLATYGVTLSFNFFQQRKWYAKFKPRNFKKITFSGLAAGFVIFSIIVTPIKLGVIILENHRYLEQSQEHIQFVNILLKNKPFTKWVFTNCPIYAFYSGLPVPPEIGVLSRKRIESKTITPEQILAVFENYHPEQVLLCKSQTIQNYLNSYLNENYLKTYQNHLGTHYLLKETPLKPLPMRNNQ